MVICFIGINVFKRYVIGASIGAIAVGVVIKTCYGTGHNQAKECKTVLV
jgi:hypothetical protein